VFLVATFILLIAFVVSFFLPHVELRASSAYNERGGNGAVTAGPADAQLAPVGATAAALDADHDPAKHNGTGPGGLPIAEDFALPKSEKRGRHRAGRGEKLY
jgi:hypothetical protein